MILYKNEEDGTVSEKDIVLSGTKLTVDGLAKTFTAKNKGKKNQVLGTAQAKDAYNALIAELKSDSWYEGKALTADPIIEEVVVEDEATNEAVEALVEDAVDVEVMMGEPVKKETPSLAQNEDLPQLKMKSTFIDEFDAKTGKAPFFIFTIKKGPYVAIKAVSGLGVYVRNVQTDELITNVPHIQKAFVEALSLFGGDIEVFGNLAGYEDLEIAAITKTNKVKLEVIDIYKEDPLYKRRADIVKLCGTNEFLSPASAVFAGRGVDFSEFYSRTMEDGGLGLLILESGMMHNVSKGIPVVRAVTKKEATILEVLPSLRDSSLYRAKVKVGSDVLVVSANKKLGFGPNALNKKATVGYDPTEVYKSLTEIID